MSDREDVRDVEFGVEFQELCATIRHYSGLRYLQVPLFFGLHGAMILALEDDLPTKMHLISGYRWALLAVPIVLCGIFLIIERDLNRYIDAFIAVAKDGWPGSFWTKVERSQSLVTRSFSIIYGVVTLATCILMYVAFSAPPALSVPH